MTDGTSVRGDDITVVFAHGAWADGSSWNRVTAGLRAVGVKALAAQLPLTSLQDDVAALERTLERVDGRAAVVGHAYAGAVIGSSRSEKVAGLVYIAALAPDEGETVGDVFYREEPDPRAPALEPDAHGYVWLPEAAFGAAFAPDGTAEEQALLASVQKPIAAGCIGTAVGRPLWRDLPRWYVVAEEDRMIPSAAQRFMADRMDARVRSIPTGHMPLITAPGLVVSLLREVVRELRDGPDESGPEH